MKEIRGDAKTVSGLLRSKYTIDYYQREYRWETKQISELIDDLTEKFLESYKPADERSEIEKYGHYFLGSIIISDKEGQKFIIDGQQRLTSLTLLLIHIYRQLTDEQQRAQIAELIFSQKFGKRSFNLDVPERTDCMQALFNGEQFDEQKQSESVINILDRYQDIEEHFPEELGGDALPFFADWLIESVHLVEITAYSDADAYTIFETMNDRGLSLTPTDMLKGYLLANITDAERRQKASDVWRKRITDLQELGKEEDADAIKTWLRSQHAVTIRERKQGAVPKDFDLVGTEFHRWIRDNERALELKRSEDFAQFIQNDFSFYAFWYGVVRRAGEQLTEGLEAIHYNAQNMFTLQYLLLLAPLRREDDEEEIRRKLRIVSAYVDILVARRIWNLRSISYSTVQYSVFLTTLEIRGKNSSELATTLVKRLAADEATFASNPLFRLHSMNGKQIHRLLARMTDYVETQAGRPSLYSSYIKRGGKDGYEIEHIWAYNFQAHTDEFNYEIEFFEYRNRIGGLLLLPKSFNASYGASSYDSKRKHYLKQNLLAQSLHEEAYERDPGFRQFLERTGLPFRAHTDFKKADLDARQDLYRMLAEQIWNPENILQEVKA